MAQKPSRSLIFATRSLKHTLFVLMFKDVKQMLQRVMAVADRTLTACNHVLSCMLLVIYDTFTVLSCLRCFSI